MPTQRLLNFTPAAVTFHAAGNVSVVRSRHAFGILADAVAYAARLRYSHVEATDVRTGERFFQAVES